MSLAALRSFSWKQEKGRKEVAKARAGRVGISAPKDQVPWLGGDGGTSPVSPTSCGGSALCRSLCSRCLLSFQAMFDWLDNAVIKLCNMSPVGTDLNTVKEQMNEMKVRGRSGTGSPVLVSHRRARAPVIHFVLVFVLLVLAGV